MAASWYIWYGRGRRMMRAPGTASKDWTQQNCDSDREAKELSCQLLQQGFTVGVIGTLPGIEPAQTIREALIRSCCEHANRR